MSQRYIGGLIYNPPGGFSGYFDGTGDFLTWTGTAAGSGAFCYEFWIFSQNGFATMRAPLGVIATSGYNSALDIRMTGSTINVSQYNVANNNFTVDPLQANTWYHIAVCRNASNQTTVFVNGARSSTGAVTIATNFSGLTSAIGRLDPSNGGDVTGYISNVRLITGSTPYDPTQTTITVPSGPLQAISGTQFLSCAYPTFRDGSSNNFTITVNGNTAVSAQNPFPQTQLPNPALGNQGNGVYSMSQYQALRSQNLWPAIDPYFDYTTLLLHGNGTNGAQNNTFLDSSTNNFTITRNGNTTQGTFTPYGSNWSNFFDGDVDGLTLAYNAAFLLDTNFTLEAWVFPTASAQQCITGMIDSGGLSNWDLYLLSGNTVRFRWINTSATVYSVTSSAITLNQWTHVAVTLSGTTLTLYVNGVLAGSTTVAGSARNNSRPVGIGRPGDYAGEYFTGYISNVRYVRGSVVYTAAFTPPTAPLTAITNTSLLTCQSNRFIDNSSNAFSLTVNGSPSVQRFSPFNPTTPYAAGTIGGSGYFDGNGDYLACGSSNTAVSFGTGDFTIEAWVYWNSIASESAIMFGNGVGWTFYIFPANKLQWGRTSPQTPSNLLTGNTTLSTGQWYHIAVTRSGTTVTLWVNGVSDGTVTDSANYSASGDLRVGISHSSNYFNGYMSNVRVVKGTAVYTSAFTPPSAPLTAITNTSILLSFTNGGIIDNAMMNDLETVGNAQISTSVSKFGGGSMAFDGSGDYLVAPANQNYLFNAGDFTVEGWFNPSTVSPANQYMAAVWGSVGQSDTNSAWQVRLETNTIKAYVVNGTSVTGVGGGGSIATGQWYHFAFVRGGSSLYLFLNGVQVGSTVTYTQTMNSPSSSFFTIGMQLPSGNSPYTGYIDDLRITKGYARYTANFTPQRSQWQDQ